MNNDKINEAIKWIQEQFAEVNYGEISITFIMRAGELQRTIKTISKSTLHDSGN